MQNMHLSALRQAETKRMHADYALARQQLVALARAEPAHSPLVAALDRVYALLQACMSGCARGEELVHMYASAQQGARRLAAVREQSSLDSRVQAACRLALSLLARAQYELESVLGPLHETPTRKQLGAAAAKLNVKWRGC